MVNTHCKGHGSIPGQVSHSPIRIKDVVLYSIIRHLLPNRLALVDPSWLLIDFSPFPVKVGKSVVLSQEAAKHQCFPLA